MLSLAVDVSQDELAVAAGAHTKNTQLRELNHIQSGFYGKRPHTWMGKESNTFGFRKAFAWRSTTRCSTCPLNGPLHVQVSLAMDAITKDLTEKRMPKPILAYLCTPTDIHLIPQEAHGASLQEYAAYRKYFFCSLFSALSRKFLRRNAKEPVEGPDGPIHYVNGLSVAQGPNYALAKRMQHWRAVVAREDQKCIVSSNIAPSTSTASVIQNKTFAWAYEGMPFFRPFEIFAPETSNAVMTALLFCDMKDPKSAANPKNDLGNPNMLFANTSFNGGAWRCAYELDSIGEASVLVYFSRLALPYLKVGGGIFLAFFAGKSMEYF